MTKSITDIAAQVYVQFNFRLKLWEFTNGRLEAFVDAIKAAHIAELAGVEMPEPDMSNNGDCFGHEDVPCYSVEKVREYAAGQVLKEHERILNLPQIAGNLFAERAIRGNV
jgi:hypothetical protein